jgi:hypothetical protein
MRDSGTGVGDERFTAQVFGIHAPLVAQTVLVGDYHLNLEPEERRNVQIAPRSGLRANHHARFRVLQKPHRVGVKAGDQIDLDLRPAAPKFVHDRHQPVETGMALQHDSKFTANFSLQANQVPLGCGHRGHGLARERQ